MNMRISVLAFMSTLFFAGPALSQDLAASARRDLAPTGKLRAAINLGNSVLANKDQSGSMSGISVDLANMLGARLGVPVTLIPYDSAGNVSASAGSDVWDICFLAVDPKRAEAIEFTAPYLVIEGSFAVPANSPIRSIADVDKAGVRIAVGRGSAYDLFLTREIKHATLVRAPTSPLSLQLFVDEKLEVAANVRQPLELFVATNPQMRLLPGYFMEIAQAMGLKKGRVAGANYLRSFINEMKANGEIAKIIQRNNQTASVPSSQ